VSNCMAVRPTPWSKLWLALFCLLAVGKACAIDYESFEDPQLQARYQALTRELRCPKCQNESIADSPSQIAADFRREVRKLLQAGKTDDEVKAYLTERYGDFVLYRPPFVARTWLLWLAPVVVLLVALGTAAAIVRRRAQLPIDNETTLQ
jgi:cytochrome c-type biogenesis protein CcmH